MPFFMHPSYFAHVGKVTEGHFAWAVKFVIELITRRKSNPSHWVSRAMCWQCFCYSLCKGGTQTDEKKRFCNREILPKKDPQSWTQLTAFSCFLSFWPKSGWSDCVVCFDQYAASWSLRRSLAVLKGQLFLKGHILEIRTRIAAFHAASFFLSIYHYSLALAPPQRRLNVFSFCPRQCTSVSVGVDNVETSGVFWASLPSALMSVNKAASLAHKTKALFWAGTVGNVHVCIEKIKSHRELKREREGQRLFPLAEQTCDKLMKPGNPPKFLASISCDQSTIMSQQASPSTD